MICLAIDPDELKRMVVIGRIIASCELAGTSLTAVDAQALAQMIEYVNNFCEPEVSNEGELRDMVERWLEAYVMMYGLPGEKIPDPNAFSVDTIQ